MDRRPPRRRARTAGRDAAAQQPPRSAAPSAASRNTVAWMLRRRRGRRARGRGRGTAAVANAARRSSERDPRRDDADVAPGMAEPQPRVLAAEERDVRRSAGSTACAASTGADGRRGGEVRAPPGERADEPEDERGERRRARRNSRDPQREQVVLADPDVNISGALNSHSSDCWSHCRRYSPCARSGPARWPGCMIDRVGHHEVAPGLQTPQRSTAPTRPTTHADDAQPSLARRRRRRAAAVAPRLQRARCTKRRRDDQRRSARSTTRPRSGTAANRSCSGAKTIRKPGRKPASIADRRRATPRAADARGPGAARSP